MTKERAYYIAYVSELAQAIEFAVENQNGKFLEQYYEVLNDELDNLNGMEDYITEVTMLIELLDEWKG